MTKNIYKEIGIVKIEGKNYPVFFEVNSGKTYYFRDGKYTFVNWNWEKK